jgi:AraC-like DNA-binding protein
MLISCGRQRVVRGDKYDWYGLKRGKEEFVVWQFTLRGAGALDYEGRTHSLKPGTALLVHIPHDHRYYLPEDSPYWEFVYMCLYGGEVVRLCMEIEERAGPAFEMPECSSSLRLASEIFKAAFKGGISTPYASSSLAYQFVMELMAEFVPYSGTSGARPEFIKKVSDFCRENLEGSVGVEDLAEISGLSRYHFSRLFKRHTKMSPMAFVNEMRLKKAVRLMQMEQLSIKEIAARCGFSDVNYFCRAFKKSRGLSPGDFKSKHGGAVASE